MTTSLKSWAALVVVLAVSGMGAVNSAEASGHGSKGGSGSHMSGSLNKSDSHRSQKSDKFDKHRDRDWNSYRYPWSYCYSSCCTPYCYAPSCCEYVPVCQECCPPPCPVYCPPAPVCCEPPCCSYAPEYCSYPSWYGYEHRYPWFDKRFEHKDEHRIKPSDSKGSHKLSDGKNGSGRGNSGMGTMNHVASNGSHGRR